MCPQVEHAPQSNEGRAVWRAAQSPGVWQSGGFGGLTGLDLVQIEARLVKPMPRAVLIELTRGLELGALEGAARRAAEKPSKDT